jgi:hypothetical protein
MSDMHVERGPENPELYQSKKSFGEFLISAEEYAELEHETPYEYHLKGGGKEILYVGTPHSHDPHEPIFEQIKSHIEQFSPDLVLIEGSASLNKYSPEDLRKEATKLSDEETILEHGEALFTAKIASEKGIRVYSPEPEENKIANYLEQKGISKDAIFAYCMARFIDAYHRYPEKPDVEEYMDRYKTYMQENIGWQNYDFSLDHFKEVQKKLWDKEFDLEDNEFYEQASDPIPWENKSYTEVNKAAAFSNRFRDEYMIDNIQDLLAQYKKILIVFGASHAVMQEPALKKLLQYEQIE